MSGKLLGKYNELKQGKVSPYQHFQTISSWFSAIAACRESGWESCREYGLSDPKQLLSLLIPQARLEKVSKTPGLSCSLLQLERYYQGIIPALLNSGGEGHTEDCAS